MSDRAAIENLLHRYSLAYDTADLDSMAECFTDDAVFRMKVPDHEPVTFESKSVILKLITDSMASQTDQRRHVNSNLVVHGTEDGATRTTHYLSLYATENGEIRLLSAGVYRNEIVDDGGQLRLRRLDLELDRPY